MNKRIRELADEARKEFLELPTGYRPEQVGMYPQLMEKFAELIVAECMSIAKQVENDKFDVAGSAEPEYRKGINDGRQNAAWGIKNRMKLHFGVEE